MADNHMVTCTFCGTDSKDSVVLCSACGRFLPLMDLDYFSIFKLKQSFDVCMQHLEVKQLSLQLSVHPDRFVGLGDGAQLKAMQYSSFLNDAYETLIDDVKRAVYLLKLHGISDVFASSTYIPQEVLVRQMAWRERAMEEDSKELYKEMKQAMQGLKESLTTAFNKKDFDSAKELTVELQFMKKIAKELKGKRV